MTDHLTDLGQQVALAADGMSAWLLELPAWRVHPTNASRSVAAHSGPTILSEHDCVMHFARFLADAGIAWEDMHLELSPGQWMFDPPPGAPRPKRIDLAIIARDRITEASRPAPIGTFAFDAVFEFALASNYWQFGSGSAGAMIRKVRADVVKTEEYLRSGMARRGYVVIVEECDHGFPPDMVAAGREGHGVEVLVLRAWR